MFLRVIDSIRGVAPITPLTFLSWYKKLRNFAQRAKSLKRSWSKKNQDCDCFARKISFHCLKIFNSLLTVAQTEKFFTTISSYFSAQQSRSVVFLRKVAVESNGGYWVFRRKFIFLNIECLPSCSNAMYSQSCERHCLVSVKKNTLCSVSNLVGRL